MLAFTFIHYKNISLPLNKVSSQYLVFEVYRLSFKFLFIEANSSHLKEFSHIMLLIRWQECEGVSSNNVFTEVFFLHISVNESYISV